MRRVFLEPCWPDSWKLSYHYDLSEVYDEPTHLGYAYAYAERRAQTLRLVTEVLQPGATILDVAAAQGNFSLALAELGFRVTWNDLRSELADYVRLKHDRGHIEYVAGNAFELEFARPFDAVLITEVIEHVAHPDAFLAGAAALVRPGGYVVMTTPTAAGFRNSCRASPTVPIRVCSSPRNWSERRGYISCCTPTRCTVSLAAGLAVERLALSRTSDDGASS
jgi:2-polyprenyl-6-hydroxyphenyl methylase/3-demethylubiquinone-9 3-methyltransferase